MSKDIDEKLERIRRRGQILLTKSQVLEATIREGMIRMGIDPGPDD